MLVIVIVEDAISFTTSRESSKSTITKRWSSVVIKNSGKGIFGNMTPAIAAIEIRMDGINQKLPPIMLAIFFKLISQKRKCQAEYCCFDSFTAEFVRI